MNTQKKLIIFTTMLAFLIMLPVARASEEDQATKLTFSKAVQVPGRVLPAGTYWFILVETNTAPNVVQIFNSDRSTLYATILTNNAEHLQPTDGIAITFADRGSMHGDAFAEVQKAASLDPLSQHWRRSGRRITRRASFGRSDNTSRKTMVLDPFFAPAHYVLGQALVRKHNYNEAIVELQKAIELSPGSTAFTANLAYAYAVSGMRDEAVKILSDLKNRSPQAFSNAPEIAMVYVGLGEKDQAMAWLEKGYAERLSPWVLMRPCFDPLRSDLDFEDLVRRMGLPRP